MQVLSNRSKALLSIVALTSLPLHSQDDPELTNYKSGISLVWGGEKGVDYIEEYLYFDKIVSDRKVIYIKDTTKINALHNERNVASPGAGAGYEEFSPVGEIIRYKIDGDERWELYPKDWLEFPANLSFSNMNYSTYGDPDLPVLGSTGHNGVPLSREYKETRYYRGMIGPYGDEWHTITVADDGTQVTDPKPNWEHGSSDGKIFYFVVNPKTPAMTVRSQNNGQFYTTPPKTYFKPVIHKQSTFFTGDVNFELRDIWGNNIYYRIVGNPSDTETPYTNVGKSSIVLTSSAFKKGEQYLQFYYDGNQGFTKTRRIVKDPPHPSSNESNGDRLWINSHHWNNEVEPRLTQQMSWWLDNWRKGRSFNKIDETIVKARTGRRLELHNATENALIYRIDGPNAKPAGQNFTYGEIAKLTLFETVTTYDPVGAELNSSGTHIPTREMFRRGYYDVVKIFDSAAAYDILIGYFRSDQQVNGITPIEDFFIRDILAMWVDLMMLNTAGYGNPVYNKKPDTGGMWDTAQKVGAAFITAMMPTYSTPYYGTSGMDGNETTYPNKPFRDEQHTWKRVFFDNDIPITDFPNIGTRLGIEEYNINPEGNWIPRIGYSSTLLMGHTLTTYWNIAKIYAPTKTFPNSVKLRKNAASGQLIGLSINRESDKKPAFRSFAAIQNNWFPEFKSEAQPKTLALPSSATESLGKQLAQGNVLSVIWYNHELPLPRLPTPPSKLITEE